MHDLAGKRVTVMGLGRFGGGGGVTRFLVAQGADVLVTDTEPADKLADSLKQLDGLPVEFRLGEHNVSDFTTCDLVVANPAVKPDNRFLRAAEAAHIPITTEVRLLVERLPNRKRTIGVTGTAGKSTTSAMIAHILRKCGTSGGVWLGGNIGGSLLNDLDKITADDWIVLELSSFQLHHLRAHDGMPGWSPHIAVVTNIAPNHLDWHGTFEEYVAAKQEILENQTSDDIACVSEPASQGLTIRGQHRPNLQSDWPESLPLLVVGSHNRRNAMTAASVVEWAGVNTGLAMKLLADFPGLPHRLQFVGEVRGVKCYNDSKSTTPEAAILAIDAFPPQTVHVILGGYDKGSDLTALAHHAAARCAAIYTLGATGPQIGVVASASHADHPARPDTCGGVAWPAPRAEVHDCGTLDVAVARALEHAKPGEVIVLSPGCASWDQFTNYEQRGDRFVQLVREASGGER